MEDRGVDLMSGWLPEGSQTCCNDKATHHTHKKPYVSKKGVPRNNGRCLL